MGACDKSFILMTTNFEHDLIFKIKYEKKIVTLANGSSIGFSGNLLETTWRRF